MRTSKQGNMEYLRVGLKGTNPRKEKWIEVGNVRELYPHIQIDWKQSFGGPKASQWGEVRGVIQGIKIFSKIKVLGIASKHTHV
jgi:hypothetical protein